MVRVNPDILRWARETAGFSLEEASQKLDFKGTAGVHQLAALEAGEINPTRSILLKMTKKYHRPLLVFYMAKPPQKDIRGQDFRTLPKEYTLASDVLVNALIRDIQARQSIIRAELEDDEDIAPLTFVNSMQVGDGVLAIMESIKNTLNFNLIEFQNKPSPKDAFTYLRSCAESVGIFVLLIGDLGSYHTAINLEAFRGFAIADTIAPFVVINDRDSKAAWSFTLIHEMTHIWLGQTGISNSNNEKDVEQFCNDVASEFLLPTQELSQFDINDKIDVNDLKLLISQFAYARNLSNSMVAYKLFKLGRIKKETWLQLNLAYQVFWNLNRDKQQNEASEKKSGPSYYIVRRDRIGTNLISTVQRMVEGGTLTSTKAGKILGVKAKNVQKLLESLNPPKNS